MSDSLIAVTGATGHLGGLVIEKLLEFRSAASLVALVRDQKKAEHLAAKGVQVRVASYDDRAALESGLTGVETLLLVSGSEVGQRVPQHVNVIDAARTAGVGRVVYTSAPKATTSELAVAAEHKATEEYLTASGLDYTILRNGWYTENYLPQVATARQTGTVVAAVGDGRVASASRADYADGAAAGGLVGDGRTGLGGRADGEGEGAGHRVAVGRDDPVGDGEGAVGQPGASGQSGPGGDPVREGPLEIGPALLGVVPAHQPA